MDNRHKLHVIQKHVCNQSARSHAMQIDQVVDVAPQNNIKHVLCLELVKLTIVHS